MANRKSRNKMLADQNSLVAFVDRGYEALKLRAKGLPYKEIMERLEYGSVSAAYDAVHRTLKQMKVEASEEVRSMELQRLDALLAGVWEDATRGNPKAIHAALAIMERRAKYLGLDSPTKADDTIEVVFSQTWRQRTTGPGDEEVVDQTPRLGTDGTTEP